MGFKHKVGIINNFKNRVVNILLAIILVATPFGSILGTLGSESANALGETQVTQTTLKGWQKYGDGVSAVVPDGSAGTIGKGALKLNTPNASQYIQYYRDAVTPTPVDQIAVSYNSKRLAGAAHAAPSYVLGVDPNGDGNSSDEFYMWFEPVYNNGENYGRWNTWTINQSSKFWSSSSVGTFGGANGANMFTLADVKAVYADAKVIDYTINMGSGNAGWTVLVDGIKIPEATYDFEPDTIQSPQNVKWIDHANNVAGAYTNVNKITAKWDAPSFGLPVAHYEYSFKSPTSNWSNPEVFNTNVIADQSFNGSGNNGQEGAWQYRVRSVSTTNVSSEWVESPTVIYDKTAPVVKIVTPTANSLHGPEINITGTATDLNLAPNSQVSVWLRPINTNGNCGGNIASTQKFVTIDSVGSWSTTISTSSINAGKYCIQAEAADAAVNKNVNTILKSVTVDKTGPTITVQPSSVGSEGVYSKLGFNFFDADKIAYITINEVVKPLTPDNYSNIDNIGSPYWHGAIEGANSLTAFDTLGNSTTVEFKIDKTAPTSTVGYSNNNGAALTREDVTVTLTSNEQLRDLNGWNRVSPNAFSKTFSDNGKFTVTLTDLAGNNSIVKGEVKRIDRNAPTISGITDGATVRGAVNLTILDPKYQGADGFDKNTGLLVNDVATPTSETSDKNYLTSISGDNTYAVKATDKAGNSTTLTFTIDNSISIVLLGDEFTTDTPEVIGRATYNADGAPAAGVELIVAIDGSNYTVTTDEDGDWSLGIAETNPLENGTYNVAVSHNGETPINAGQITIAKPVVPGDNNPNPEDGQTNTPQSSQPLSTIATPATITPFFQNFATVFNNDGTVSALTAPTAENADENGQVLGAENSLAKNAAQADSSKKGFEVFGFAWYWIVAAIAALLAGWWFLAGYRRRKDNQA